MAEETSGREQESFLGDVFGVEAKLTSFSLPLSVFDGEEQASVGAVDVCPPRISSKMPANFFENPPNSFETREHDRNTG